MTSSKHEQLSMSWSGVLHFQVWGMYWSTAGIFLGKNKPRVIETDLFMFE